MHTRFFLSIALIIMSVNFLVGQKYIRGYTSLRNEIRLPYATIKVFKDTLHIKTAVCDSAGNFKIEIPKDQEPVAIRLQAFFLRFESERRLVENFSLPVELIIRADTQILKEVTVVASKSTLTKQEDRFIFTPDKNLATGSTALDIMRYVPLINYNEKDEAFAIISKPGTIVYINNKKTKLPKDMLIATLRSTPAENIKNIEIITSPGSEFEANSSAGIVNINIKHDLADGWFGNFSVYSQQSVYNTAGLNGAINYRQGKLGIQLSPSFNNDVNYSKTINFFEYKEQNTTLLKTRYFRRYQVIGGGLNIDYDINAKNFVSYNGWLSGVNGNSNNSTNGFFYRYAKNIPDSITSTLATGNDNFLYNFGNLNYHSNLDSLGQKYIDVNIDYNGFTQRRNNDGIFSKVNLDENEIISNGGYTNRLPQQLINISERIEYVTRLKQNIKLNVGIQNSDTKVHNNLIYYNKAQDILILDQNLSNNYHYKENYTAAFFSLSKKITEKWSAKVGLRAEKTVYLSEVTNLKISKDSNYFNLFPSVAVSYSPDKRNQFSLTFNRKINRPNIERLFPGRTYSNRNYFIENNPFLQPSLSNNTELSYTFKNKLTFLLNYDNITNASAQFIVPVIEDNLAKLKKTFINYGSIKRLTLTSSFNQSLLKNRWNTYLAPIINFTEFSGLASTIPVHINNFSHTILMNNSFVLSEKNKWYTFLTFKYNSPQKTISSYTLNATSSLDLGVKKLFSNTISALLYLSDIYNGNSIYKNDLYANYLLSRNSSETNSFNRSISLQVRCMLGNNKVKKNKQRSTANEEIKNRAN